MFVEVAAIKTVPFENNPDAVLFLNLLGYAVYWKLRVMF
jgi:hypothetical protein